MGGVGSVRGAGVYWGGHMGGLGGLWGCMGAVGIYGVLMELYGVDTRLLRGCYGALWGHYGDL